MKAASKTLKTYIKNYIKNPENPLYTEGFAVLYFRSCDVRKDAQIKITYRDSDGWCPDGVKAGSG